MKRSKRSSYADVDPAESGHPKRVFALELSHKQRFSPKRNNAASPRRWDQALKSSAFSKPKWAVAVLVLLLGIWFVFAIADRSSKEEPTAFQPWQFRSTAAPYALAFGPQWERESAKSLNSFADLAVFLPVSEASETSDSGSAHSEAEDRGLLLMVIPQELPRVGEAPLPSLEKLKEAYLDILKEQDEAFEVERQGSIQLDGQPAFSVFATGESVGERVYYVLTYAQYRSWGFQIVGLAPYDLRDKLVEGVDEVLSTWTYTKAPPSPVKNGVIEGSTDAARDDWVEDQ